METYVQVSIQELIYLLKHKNTSLPGLKSTIAQTTLIKLADILNTNTMDLKLDSNTRQYSTSEGAGSKVIAVEIP